jgi:hypothetical protein
MEFCPIDFSEAASNWFVFIGLSTFADMLAPTDPIYEAFDLTGLCIVKVDL